MWTADYTGAPFELFGAPHLASLALVVVGTVAIVTRGRRLTLGGRRNVRIGMAILLVVNEALWHVWALTENLYQIQEMLPLHLCSVMVWATAYALAANDRRLYAAVYFLGVAGASQALLTPDAGIYGFPHVRFMQTMISHGLVFIAGVYVVAVEGCRPSVRSALRIFVGLNIYALLVGLLNAVIGSNYLYVNGKPETPSLIDMMPAWPWYLLYLEVIAAGLLVVLCAPFVRTSREYEPAVRETAEVITPD
jgi:hypothetical integral membrane protein (TIGR02206 family)